MGCKYLLYYLQQSPSSSDISASPVYIYTQDTVDDLNLSTGRTESVNVNSCSVFLHTSQRTHRHTHSVQIHTVVWSKAAVHLRNPELHQSCEKKHIYQQLKVEFCFLWRVCSILPSSCYHFLFCCLNMSWYLLYNITAYKETFRIHTKNTLWKGCICAGSWLPQNLAFYAPSIYWFSVITLNAPLDKCT